MRDLMTLYAVESGLPRGAQPQAAALLLAALQVCFFLCFLCYLERRKNIAIAENEKKTLSSESSTKCDQQCHYQDSSQ